MPGADEQLHVTGTDSLEEFCASSVAAYPRLAWVQGRHDPADYVLRNFNAKEREELAFTLPTAAEAVELIASHGLEIAQNQVHGR